MFIFRALVVAMVFVGSVVQVQTVWDTADLFMGLMAIINIVALFGLATVVFEVAKDYRAQRKRKLNPVFKIENLKVNYNNIEAWGDNPYATLNKKETTEQSSEANTKYEEPKQDTFDIIKDDDKDEDK